MFRLVVIKSNGFFKYFVTDDDGWQHRNMSSKLKHVVTFLKITTYNFPTQEGQLRVGSAFLQCY